MNAIGVPPSAYDRVVTSGDVTRDLIAEGPRKIFHIGADRDFTLYEGLDVELVEEFEASGVVCTGLFDDEVEKPEDYAELLRRLRARNLPSSAQIPTSWSNVANASSGVPARWRVTMPSSAAAH